MNINLPSLNALRAFESAGRYGSFTKAADALHVSPGSISRFIGVLEQDLGVKLFVRSERGVQLTALGQEYYESVTNALNEIRRSTLNVRGGRFETPTLSVWMYPTVGTEWFFPRLNELKTEFPGVQFRYVLTSDSKDLHAGDADIGFVASIPKYELSGTYYQETLLDEVYFPVCTPSLAQELKGMEFEKILSTTPFLFSENLEVEWKGWFAQMGFENEAPEDVIWFDNSAAAYRAARDGIGIALGERICVADAISNRQLTPLFGDSFYRGGQFLFVYLPGHAHKDTITKFRSWLVKEIASTLQMDEIAFAIDDQAHALIERANS